MRQQFEREAQTIASLNHPHICVLHDIGRQEGIDYLVMEYLEGETLARRIERGALPLADALKGNAWIMMSSSKSGRTAWSTRSRLWAFGRLAIHRQAGSKFSASCGLDSPAKLIGEMAQPEGCAIFLLLEFL
jgi:hypothetical protein